MGKQVNVYDPAKVISTGDGLVDTGFAEDSKISVEKEKENAIPYGSIDGESVAMSIVNDKTAIATLSFASNSPTLSKYRTLARQGKGFTYSMVDMNDDGVNIACDDCYVLKEPAISRQGEVEDIEVEIFIPFLY